MIRQARTYLLGAISGAALIAVAIAVSALLVSVQVFADWPLSALRAGEKPSLSDARPAASGNGVAGVDALGAPSHGAVPALATAGSPADGRSPVSGGSVSAEIVDGDPVAAGEGPASGATPSPAAGSEGESDPGASPTPGRSAGTAPSRSESPGAASGGGSSSGSPSPAPPSSETPGGSSGSKAPPRSTSGTVAETVNGTVAAVDQGALGGTLDKTGVTGVTEGVVDGVAGPESTVGQVVDGVVDSVGGLLKPRR